jgi:hypothetical protein
MRSRLLVCAAFVLGSSCALLPGRSTNAPAKADPATLRMSRSGAVVGTSGRHGGHAWLGIPYARAPVGELRWRAPMPPESWSGTRETIRFAPPCSQLASPFGGIEA